MKTLQDHIHSTERSGHIEFSVEERNEDYVRGIKTVPGCHEIFFLQLSRKLTNLHGNSIPLPGEAILLIFLSFSLPCKTYEGSPSFHCQFSLRN
jgi:hypothetical protein